MIKKYDCGALKYVYDIAIERYIIEKSLIQEDLHNKINDMEFYLVVLNSNNVLDQEINLDIIDYPTDKLGHELTICYDLTNITKEYFSKIENQIDKKEEERTKTINDRTNIINKLKSKTSNKKNKNNKKIT